MEKRIELEKRGKSPNQIKELNLDNCRSTSIVGLTDDFINLELLSLINVGLTSLKGFPKLPNLKKLELSDNRISGGLNLLHTSPKLSHLNLSGNKISSLEALEPLKEFKQLKSLDLFNNEATSIVNYRELVFNLIPGLKFLDGFDVEEREAEDSEGEDDEVNGNDEDSEEIEEILISDEDEEGLEDEEDDEEDDDVGLDAVYKDNLDEESDGEDYEGEAGEEEDDDVLDEEEEDGVEDGADEESAEVAEASQGRGKKRKHEGEEEVN